MREIVHLMKPSSPTSFISVQDFLVEALKERQKRNSRFSLRAWSKQLGYRNPSLLSDVLCGRRRPSSDLMRRIIANLNLSEADELSFIELCKQTSHGSKSTAEPAGHQHPSGIDSHFNKLALDKFRLIADWYHLAILELFLIKGFEPSAKQIIARLTGKIPRSFVNTALARLHRLNLLTKDKSGILRRTKLAAGVFIGEDISDTAVRNHHRQMLEMATEALDKQDLSERDYSGSTVAIKKSDLVKLRKAIYDLHLMFNKLSAEPGNGEAVYRLNIQLFRVDKDLEEERT